MRLLASPIPLLLLALSTLSTFAADPADAKALRGTIKRPAGLSLGVSGARVFRGAPEWNAFMDRLGSFGWKKPADDPTVMTDFSKEMVVCVFQQSDDWNKFAVRKCASDGKQGDVEIAIAWILQKAGAPHEQDWKFICVALPKAPCLKVSVLAYTPMNGGGPQTVETANPEWVANFDESAGDNVGSLQGAIKADAATVKPGDDIQVSFTLQFSDPCVEKLGFFAKPVASVGIWDGKFSNGYRNHAFLVTTPDGKSRILRPAVKNGWDKNAPHLVEVTKDRPYTLPEWQEGVTLKSLKELGLDTTVAGKYTITGIYAEGVGAPDVEAKGSPLTWRGEIYTNTIVVEVK